MKKKLTGALMAAIITFTTAAIADDKQTMPVKAGVISQFSPEIQELFTKEMIGIQNAMMQIIPAITAGEWDRVAAFAEEMAMGHIMKQKLTPQQMEALHDGLPTGFKVLDNKFHDQAAMLAHVTRERHLELTTFYYYKLTETCIECHSQFALKRFPGLSTPSQAHTIHEGKHGDSHEKPQQHQH